MRNYWGVVPAAGRGERFGEDVPKQYIRVAGGFVIEHSLAALLRGEELRRVIVSLAEGDDLWSQVRYSRDPRVTCCQGGKNRACSVMAALETLRGQAAPDDWIIVHDAVRPCLSEGQLSTLVEATKGDSVGGLLVALGSDALKLLNINSDVPAIEHTLNRGNIVRALTPQMFRFGLLSKALGNALEAGISVDDEAQAVEIAGHRVLAVAGDGANVKLTYKHELLLIESWLNDHRCLEIA